MKTVALDARTVGADQPTLDEFQGLPAQGYTLVVNLRERGEPEPAATRATVEGAGMQYRRIPISGAGFRAEDARSLREALGAAGDGRALIYCSTGSRAGVLWAAMHALEQGMDADAAVALAQRSGDVRPGALERLRQVVGG